MNLKFKNVSFMVVGIIFAMFLLVNYPTRIIKQAAAKQNDTVAMWEYGELSTTRSSYTLNNEQGFICSWEAKNADAITAKSLEELATKLNFKEKATNTTWIINILAQQGWELVTHCAYVRNMSSSNPLTNSLETTVVTKQVWMLRRKL